MPLETLDRLLDVEPGVRASALRNVPNSLAVFDSHFPRFPVLPGVLILDSLAELAGLAVGGGPWRLEGAERVRFRHFVRPGDQLLLTVAVTGADLSRPALSGAVSVGERTVVSVRSLRLRAAA
jgi:3-hydroxyacyl-[acyl-carrier-protein] dehydratase